MINIRSHFDEVIQEKVDYEGNLGSYLDSIDKMWRKRTEQPISIYINDEFITPFDCDSINVTDSDIVDIYVLPQGSILKPITNLVGGILDFAFGWLMPSSRTNKAQSSTTQSSKTLDTVDIKANQVKFGDVVPEGFGKFRRYPDYLSKPRRRFTAPNVQTVDALLCVGVGEYEIEEVKIGDTPIDDFAGSSITKFTSNEQIPARYAEIWHTVDEVGATSSGSAGLDMNGFGQSNEEEPTMPNMQNTPPADGYTFNSLEIKRNDNTKWNERWNNTTEIEIGFVDQYEVLNTNIYQIEGFFGFRDVSSLPDIERLAYVNGRWYTRTYRPVLHSINNATGVGIVRYTYNDIILALSSTGESAGKKQLTFKIKSMISSISDDTLTLQSKNNAFFPSNFISEESTILYVSGGDTGASSTSTMPFTNMYQATPEGVKTDLIEVDFFFPSGLIWAYRDPAYPFPFHFYFSVTVEVQIIDADTNVIVKTQTQTFTNNTVDQVGYTMQIEIPVMTEALVRVRRLAAESILSEISDKVTWFGLKSRIGYKDKYENWTSVGITMQTGGRVAMSSENRVNMIQTRILPELQENGTWSAPKPTRDIASVVKYITNSIGYSDNDIDMQELAHINNKYWKPRGEYFDYIFDATTIKSALDTALNAGMSDMTIANGKIKPVRDDIRTTVEQSYSAQNTIAEISHKFRSRKTNDYDGIEVEYVDNETYDKRVVVCALPDSERLKLRKIAIKGVTDRKRAWQIGMRLASEDRYVNKDYSIKTEMDALNSEYGSFIGIIEEIPELSQSCLILQVNDDHVVVSESPLQDATIFSWRDEYGKLQGPFSIDRVEDNKVYVNLNKRPTVTLNQELPHAYIGTSQKMTRKALVDDISPNGTNNATIRASNYDERVYAYDNSEIIE